MLSEESGFFVKEMLGLAALQPYRSLSSLLKSKRRYVAGQGQDGILGEDGQDGSLSSKPDPGQMHSSCLPCALHITDLRLELMLAGQLPSRRTRIRHCGENLLRF